ncbi:titin [Trichomycterus rosablanca]|uniref:titin n=1 Tax=Trichomycterus rosablanca TaxID=2290929 RepID=UPI002F35E233
MEDKTKSSVGTDAGFCGVAPLHPPSYGWQPSLLYNQHFGQPPFIDFRDLSWMESVFRKLWTSSWSGYTRSVEFTPQPGLKIHREMGGGVSEVTTQQCKWRVSLDVNHFAPSEITIRTHDGFLVVGGTHDERQDEHGYISRSFVRKYKLPDGIEATSIHSFITGDGVLTVEVPLPDLPPAADTTISVQVEMEAPKLEDQKLDERRRPGVTERDVVTGPFAEKPDVGARPVGADERIRWIDGAPEDLRDQERVDAAEEAAVIQEEDKKRKEEEQKMEEGAEERVDSVGVTDKVPDLPEEPKTPTAPEEPEAPRPSDMATPEGDRRILEEEKEREIQEQEDQRPVQEPEPVDGEPRRVKPEEEQPVPVQTQEEIQPQLDITEQRAIEHMKKSE